MKVERRFELTEKKPSLQVGDVIEHNEYGFFLVIELDNEYVARSFNGSTGLFGRYSSLRELNEAFYSRDTHKKSTVYKASEFTLQLVKN
jgi:hypothetical protein